jgi:hypothetical protein
VTVDGDSSECLPVRCVEQDGVLVENELDEFG